MNFQNVLCIRMLGSLNWVVCLIFLFNILLGTLIQFQAPLNRFHPHQLHHQLPEMLRQTQPQQVNVMQSTSYVAICTYADA